MKLRIIIGQGTATEVYRATLDADDGYQTLVIGPRGLWASLPEEHRMGQTPQLLQLPGQPVPAHVTASGKTEQGLSNFLDVNTYQEGLRALAKRNDTKPGTVTKVIVKREVIQLDQLRATKIKPGFRDGQLCVETNNPKVTFLAEQVILATGIGPQQVPPKPTGEPDATLPFKQLMEGIDYLNAPAPYGREVAVYGGSATAAWVAAEACGRAKKMLWFTRPGGSEFSGCTLPGDRNYMVLEKTKDLRLLASLQSIDYLPAKRVGNRLLRRPMVKLTLRSQGKPDRICLVDQLIYSIGGNPAGAGSIQNLVVAELRSTLQPLKDNNRVISDGKGVLAIATPSRNLIIIGASTYNYSDATLSKQSAPMATLPRASQVPDGIAMIVASVQAMNSYMPFKQDQQGNLTESNMNLNLANRDQLAVYLSIYYPELSPSAANEVVVRVVALRSSKADGKEFGVTEGELQKIIEQYVK